MSPENSDYYIKNTQIIIIAGGLGTRLKHRTGDLIPKALLKVGKKTLLDYCIEMFLKKGFSNFVFLLGNGSKKILEHLKNYPELKMKYSIEEKKLGKAGAIKLAMENKTIDKTKPAIITYPDDLIFDNNFPEKLLEKHKEGVDKGAKCTLVCVDRTRYKYGVSHLENGFVKKFEEKPFVFMDTNVGIYMLEPEIFEIIEKHVTLEKQTDFENKILPMLVKDNLVYTCHIPFDAWIPVNEEKEYKKAEELLSSD